MKLELKHLSPYLPYNLKLVYHDSKIGQLTRLSDIREYDDIKISIDFNELEHIWMFKPILRPMSDLFINVTINEIHMIPINQLKMIYGWEYLYEEIFKGGQSFNVNALKYGCLRKLLEWHFDVFGLIEKGIAININNIQLKNK